MILGEQPKPALEILVPADYAEREVFGRCLVCGAKFYAGQEAVWEKHVGPCARANIDALQAESPISRNRGTIFDPETWDPELDAHFREVGKTMKREGRLEVKPSERGGF